MLTDHLVSYHCSVELLHFVAKTLQIVHVLYNTCYWFQFGGYCVLQITHGGGNEL